MTDRHARSLTLVLLLAAAPASALEIVPHMSPCAVAMTLAPEVSRLTGYPAPDRCPRISRTLPAAGTTGQAQVGAYFPETGAIALAADLDLTTRWGQSVLLHEMVHAAQHKAKGIPACRAAMEYEAYEAQASYLRMNGLQRDATMLFVLGTLVSACSSHSTGMP